MIWVWAHNKHAVNKDNILMLIGVNFWLDPPVFKLFYTLSSF